MKCRFFCKDERRRDVDSSTVEGFRLERYLGLWYEIARYNNRFERGLKQVMTEYSLLGEGTLKVINCGFDSMKGKPRHITGRARTTDVPGLLQVSFFWKFYSDYRVLALDEDYRWALVGGGKAVRFLWILARTPMLPKETLDVILDEARRRGFDTGRLIFG